MLSTTPGYGHIISQTPNTTSPTASVVPVSNEEHRLSEVAERCLLAYTVHKEIPQIILLRRRKTPIIVARAYRSVNVPESDTKYEVLDYLCSDVTLWTDEVRQVWQPIVRSHLILAVKHALSGKRIENLVNPSLLDDPRAMECAMIVQSLPQLAPYHRYYAWTDKVAEAIKLLHAKLNVDRYCGHVKDHRQVQS